VPGGPRARAVSRSQASPQVDGLLREPQAQCSPHLSTLRHQPPDTFYRWRCRYSPRQLGTLEDAFSPPSRGASAYMEPGADGSGAGPVGAVSPLGQKPALSAAKGQAGSASAAEGLVCFYLHGGAHLAPTQTARPAGGATTSTCFRPPADSPRALCVCKLKEYCGASAGSVAQLLR
jgi:hypothetical protein